MTSFLVSLSFLNIFRKLKGAYSQFPSFRGVYTPETGKLHPAWKTPPRMSAANFWPVETPDERR
jgi:hypothetical protein